MFILFAGSCRHTLSHNVILVGFGKAVCGMCRVFQDILGEHIVSGALSIPQGMTNDLEKAGKRYILMFTFSKFCQCESFLV